MQDLYHQQYDGGDETRMLVEFGLTVALYAFCRFSHLLTVVSTRTIAKLKLVPGQDRHL